MGSRNLIYRYLGGLLALLFIAPFIYITKFTYLSADDFCRATTDFNGYWANISEWYISHNGRFVNAFFSFLPVYDLQVYRSVLAVSMLVLGFAIYSFITSAFRYFNFPIGRAQSFFLAVLFYIVLISQLPLVYEFFYWYAGVSAYLYSITGFLFLLSFLLSKNLKNKRRTALVAFLIVLVIGNNEMLILLTNLVLMIFFLSSLFIEKRFSRKILFLNVISLMSSLAVIFSPGSVGRQLYYPEGGDIIYSLTSAVLSSGMFMLKSLIELPYVFLYIGVFLFILHQKIIKTGPMKTINPLLLFFLSLLGLISVLFIPYYAIGHLNVNRGRIGNMVHAVLLIILLFNLVNLSLFIKNKYSKFRLQTGYFSLGFIAVFVVFLVSFNSNYRRLKKDFQTSEFRRFEKDMEYRTLQIENAEGPHIKIKRISGTRTIKHYGISADEQYWTNLCYTKLVNQFYNGKIETIVIEKYQK